MDYERKAYYRAMFKLKIYENEGVSFQTFFERIMAKKYKTDFVAVKPYGNIGDRKNDGYLVSEKTYFQVYGPENLEKSIYYAISKFNTDSEGLLHYWPDAKKIVYVVNDKFDGITATAAEQYNKLIETVDSKNLSISNTNDDKVLVELWRACTLQDILFELTEEDIQEIVETPIDEEKINILGDKELCDVISYIMKTPYNEESEELFSPDYEEKIKINGFSVKIADSLRNEHLDARTIEHYFDNYGTTLEDDLRNRIIRKYKESIVLSTHEDNPVLMDEVYVNLLGLLTNIKDRSHVKAVQSLIAYYFECCDIFESPKKR